jgi:predicted dehydrogenase
MRVAVLSFWHVHGKDYANEAVAHPGTELVAIWDEDAARGHAMATHYGVEFIAEYRDVLARSDIAGVIITAPTAMHRELMVAAANAGKHIFTEKVIAAHVRDAEAIMEAVARNQVTLVVSLYRRYHASSVAIKAIIDSGALGELTYVRVRDSHNGALRTAENPNGWLVGTFFDPIQAQGGVVTDLCHPIYLTRYFLGRPVSVSATYGSYSQRAVEDNAVLSLRYANGAIGIAETSFAARYSPFSVEIHGTEGSLLYDQMGIGEMIDERRDAAAGNPHDPATRLFGMHRVLRVRSTKLDDAKTEWLQHTIPEQSDPPTAYSQWVRHIADKTAPTENNQLGMDLTAIVEAANLSAAEDRGVRLDSLSHHA